MKERPILFSAPMVRAILEGRKTQTRRVMRVDNHPAVHDWVIDSEGRAAARALNDQVLRQYVTTFPHGRVLCPYGAVGDRLWVRETWREREPDQDSFSLEYRADRPEYRTRADDPCSVPWRPSIHMPRVVSRITLEVTGVRVERLQAISEADVRAEGIGTECHVRCFQSLWSSINGAESWAANPWVWVVEFKRATQ